MTERPTISTVAERPSLPGPADVIDTVLVKGLTIDTYVRRSLIGVDLLVPVTGSEGGEATYLRLADAVDRLGDAHDMNETGNDDQSMFETVGQKVREFFNIDTDESDRERDAAQRREGGLR
ncbi:hypothetical protein [Sinosporangium siamense]|uniref:Uncharacterized protein n=1 Tax=Sinosporangium siamense TaxID=1367973 RepID=A0A919RJG5_9ACTN|nr:hypothetical protein [Sinosporangium siamense]GII94957.1 hypothetical protein Ssi02_51880 [Sinosporangium siamense]